MRARAALALALGSLALAAPVARAAGPPIVGAAWSSEVLSSSARLAAAIDPNELASSYHFEYMTEAAYQASGGSFTNALRAPAVNDATVVHPCSSAAACNQQLVFDLTPGTTYRYRVLARNSATSPAYAIGSTHTFTTQSLGGGALLADGRGWEMVSPVDKNGGQVDPPGAIAGGGVLQAAAAGGRVTYGSSASFAGGLGAPPASQYVAGREAGGWSTENLTAPIFSGSYDTADEGVPYQLFSSDLARGLLLNGDHCRGGAEGCAVANPPLAGTEAPEGYQDYYLRQGGGYEALLTSADVTGLGLSAAAFDLRFAGASPDLGHVVLSTCAALTADAIEVPQGPGCDPAQQNLYEWSAGAGLSLVNLEPGDAQGTPGAALAAQSAAVSANGARVYWTDTATGDLYLREGGQSLQADADAGGGGSFETASADGSVAFFTAAGHLWRYLAGGSATDLTPAGGVAGVLGASAAGDVVYYQDAGGLQRWSSGTTTQVAPGAAADPGDYPPSTGTARVSADGGKLLFLSSAPLTGYDNTDLVTGNPDSEVFLYDGQLTCVSCNPTNERPLGPATIPGAIANGTAPGSTRSYKPRVLSANGRRVFFDSADSLAVVDTNTDHTTGAGIPDAYQWEASGEGSCTLPAGCISLISSGRSVGGARFVDASADGSDAFFLTDGSLAPQDPGAIDLYDARVGGGFSQPPAPIPCAGDTCQPLPSPPGNQTLTTLLRGAGNPAVRYVKHCRKGLVKRQGKCTRRKHHHRHGGRGR